MFPGLEMPPTGGKVSSAGMSTWGPKAFPQGVSSLQLTSRYEGLERGFGSLLLALSFLCGELKAARLEVCPRPVVNQAMSADY